MKLGEVVEYSSYGEPRRGTVVNVGRGVVWVEREDNGRLQWLHAPGVESVTEIREERDNG